eukprot:COSAG04_NODE_730_length_10737_cov_31.931002_10_plen_246_part_00
MLLAGPARGLARRPLLGPSLPALPAGCRCHRRPLSTGEPYMTDVREITPGMESDLGDGVPLPSEPEQEAPRTSRERLAAFLEMRCDPLLHSHLSACPPNRPPLRPADAMAALERVLVWGREVFAAETADEIAEMKKEIRFLAAGYQLAANAAAAAPDEAAAMVRGNSPTLRLLLLLLSVLRCAAAAAHCGHAATPRAPRSHHSSRRSPRCTCHVRPQVREECERRGVLINDELKATEELAELCFG